MTWSFTAHFEALEPGRPDPPGTEAVRADLCRALEAELHRRGLWAASPSYVGVLGHRRWDREALDELSDDCYLYQLTRLRSLKAHLLAGADVDGFVLLNVRHFVFERQRAHDPLGYRVFEMIQRAIVPMVEDGRLVRRDGGERLHNDSVLAFAAGRGSVPAAADTLAPIVRCWSDDLLPALVTARGRPQREAVVTRLAAHLEELPRLGVQTFRFGDLAEPLKCDVRYRWAALDEQEAAIASERDGDLAALVRTVQPDVSIEERERFAKLVECIAGRLAGLPAGRQAGELLSLLSALARNASDPESDEPLSQRSLARETAIPRHRLPALFVRLAEVMADCTRAIDGPRPVNDRRATTGRGETS